MRPARRYAWLCLLAVAAGACLVSFRSIYEPDLWWHLARIFQDSRLQAYPASHFRAIIDASRSTDAWAGLTRGVDWAVLSLPRVNELSGVGRFDPAAWGTACRDRAIEIVVRRNGAHGALVDGAPIR